MPASVHCPKAPCDSTPSRAKNQEIRSDSQAIGPSGTKTVSNSGGKSCLFVFVLPSSLGMGIDRLASKPSGKPSADWSAGFPK